MALKHCPECQGTVSSDAKTCPHCGKRLTGGGGCSSAFIVLIVLVFIGLAKRASDTPTPTGTKTNEPDPRTLARNYTKIKVTSLEKAGFDNIMVINAIITNGNNFPVKDIEITCTPVAKSGTELPKLVRTVYDKVATKGQITVTKFSMGIMSTQTHQAGCEVTNAFPG